MSDLYFFMKKVRDIEPNLHRNIMNYFSVRLNNKTFNLLDGNSLKSKLIMATLKRPGSIIFCSNPSYLNKLKNYVHLTYGYNCVILYGFDNFQPKIFSHNCNIRKIVIPTIINYLPSSAFMYSFIQHVNIENIEMLSEFTFSYSHIRSIKLSKNLKSIPMNCFFGCSMLQNVEIPKDNNLLSIEWGAFNGCISLININITNNIINIGENSFSNCHSLRIFKYPKKINYIHKNFVESDLDVIYFPKKLIKINNKIKNMFNTKILYY